MGRFDDQPCLTTGGSRYDRAGCPHFCDFEESFAQKTWRWSLGSSEKSDDPRGWCCCDVGIYRNP